MKNMTFGQLLEKLLYLSNQKKSTLAKSLGYDISYISKWINGKNLPTQKSISNICKSTAEFIVNSLTSTSMQDLKNYFEIDANIDNDEVLIQYLEENLKESYMETAQKSLPNIYKSTHWEDNYNGMIHINPRLRKQYLSKDFESFITKCNDLDMIICANLYKINPNDKMSIALMKSELAQLEDQSKVKIKLIIGFEGNEDDIIINTILIINMIALHACMDFEVYNCNIDSNSIVAVIKNRIFHSAVYTRDKRCLFTSMSKEKKTIDEMYYNLEELFKNQGKLLVKKSSSIDLIKEKIYIQYIMGQDLRWLIGAMNELLMPFDLFEEVSKTVFGDNVELLDELKNINMFLQSVTYSSKLKVLIYASHLKRYISSGELNFFNNPVTLTFEQRERHLKYIEKLILESDVVELKLLDGSFVDDFKDSADPSLYLSKSLKLIPIHPENNKNDYAILNDHEFKNICDKFFDDVWENRKDIVIDDKEEILERLQKALVYSKIISGNFKTNLN